MNGVIQLTKAGQRSQTIRAGHADIHNWQVELVLLEQLDGLLAARNSAGNLSR